MSANINNTLDTQYLQEIYGGDHSILQIMFKFFLEDSLKTWQEISLSIENRDFMKVRAQVHQIKPSFSMVGLTHFHSKILAFENLSNSNPTKEILLANYLSLDEYVREAKTVIEVALMEISSIN